MTAARGPVRYETTLTRWARCSHARRAANARVLARCRFTTTHIHQLPHDIENNR